jgi:hypothetical protein
LNTHKWYYTQIAYSWSKQTKKMLLKEYKTEAIKTILIEAKITILVSDF